MNKRYGIAIFLALAVFLIAACGSDPTPVPTSAPDVIAPTKTPASVATKAPTKTPAPTATKAPTNTPAPTVVPTPVPTIDLNAARSNQPPHVFVGTAKIDGIAAPRGTLVSALIGDQTVALGVVDKADGGFTAILVDVLNQPVTFKVGEFVASNPAVRTKMGAGNTLELNASSQ